MIAKVATDHLELSSGTMVAVPAARSVLVHQVINTGVMRLIVVKHAPLSVTHATVWVVLRVTYLR